VTVQWSGLNLITDKMEVFSESLYASNATTISHIMAVVYIIEVEVDGASSSRSMSFSGSVGLYLESNMDIYVSEPPKEFAFILIIWGR
jgi:hypothetical protein